MSGENQTKRGISCAEKIWLGRRMKTKGDVKIAGEFTVDDWKARKISLETVGGPDNWKQAYDDFFVGRLETRYFEPIRLLKKHGGREGVGFSIVALHCTLIEFLASTLEGKNYKHRPRGADANWICGDYEYSGSCKVFSHFLAEQIPFKDHFNSIRAAVKFYENVRCPLLHEARTKDGWRILAGSSSDPPIDVTNKKIYRDNLQLAFDEFVKWYGEKLPECEKLQEAFIRKFCSLCND